MRSVEDGLIQLLLDDFVQQSVEKVLDGNGVNNQKRRQKVRKSRVQMDGLPIVDATTDLKLSITKADVQGSRKKDPSKCAAAQALSRTFKTEAKVFMSRTYIKSPDKKSWLRFITPEPIAREITSFDRGSSFECGEYKLRRPSKGQQLGHYRGESTRTTNLAYKPKRVMHTTAQVRGWGGR